MFSWILIIDFFFPHLKKINNHYNKIDFQSEQSTSRLCRFTKDQSESCGLWYCLCCYNHNDTNGLFFFNKTSVCFLPAAAVG